MSKRRKISPIVNNVIFMKREEPIMEDFTLHDDTQKEIIKHLKVTENLLSIITSKLSNQKKEAKIIALPDLGISHNVTRMMGGFFTGACYSWDCSVPFIPIDATVNACGTAIYKLRKEMDTNEFVKRVFKELKDQSKYNWNYTEGNHFIILAHSKGEYKLESGNYLIVHASATEYKYGKNGLYPNENAWYQKDIQKEVDKKSNRYLRYITGETAIKFYQIAKELLLFNQERNRYFCERALGNSFYEKEILNINHYGMPNNHTICIGAHYEPKEYPLLTSFQKPIYIITPKKDSISYSPHGFGLYLENPIIKYNQNMINIGGKDFSYGESIEIGRDAITRQSLDNNNLDTYVERILTTCHGNITGKLYQIASISKDGVNVFQKERKRS